MIAVNIVNGDMEYIMIIQVLIFVRNVLRTVKTAKTTHHIVEVVSLHI